jgi:predicted lipid-binding transport protein (Tim44 family)
MKCTNHPEIEAAGVCVVCGKPFCAECIQIQDNRYVCDKHREDAPPAKESRVKPGWALVLNFFPGLGYLYLGDLTKALVVFLIFAGLTMLGGEDNGHGLFITALIAYAVVDGYRQAKAMNSAPAAPAQEPSSPSRLHGGIAGGIILIVLGLFLLLDQVYDIDFEPILRLWPLALIGMGGWLIYRHFKSREQEGEPPAEPPQS